MSQTFHITIVQTAYTNAHGRRSLVRGRVVDEKHLKKRDAKEVKSRSTRMQRLLGNMKATKRGTTCARRYKTEKVPIEQAANKPRGEDIQTTAMSPPYPHHGHADDSKYVHKSDPLPPSIIHDPQGFDMSSYLPAIHFRAPMRGRSGHRLDSALSDLDLSPCLLDALTKTVN